MAVKTRSAALRWRTADEDAGGTLFPDETAVQRHVGTGVYQGMEFLHVNAKSIINSLPPGSPMPFRHTLNAYRGCSHACTYCFARPTHDYLGLGIGEDFERKIVVKINAVERLRAELRSPKWQGEPIAMGTNTDPYQSAEGKYHLTQGIIDVLGEAANPFSILTKSTLVLRDLKRLVAAARRTTVRLDLSIGSLDRDVWRLTEPGTPPPDRRIEAVRKLNEAGIPCGVLVAPVLPGFSDREDQIRQVVEACVDAGAVSISPVGLHLRPGVRAHYLDWVRGVRPDLLGLYQERFRAGAYQPKEYSAWLSHFVSTVVGERRAAWTEAELAVGGAGMRAVDGFGVGGGGGGPMVSEDWFKVIGQTYRDGSTGRIVSGAEGELGPTVDPGPRGSAISRESVAARDRRPAAALAGGASAAAVPTPVGPAAALTVEQPRLL